MRIQRQGLEGRLQVDSAGTHGYHSGEAPDPRAGRAAARRGYDLSKLRARKLELRDFQEFDLLLAMDRGHQELMLSMAPPVYHDKVRLFMSFSDATGREEVPDPFYGGEAGFEVVLDLCEQGVDGLIASLGIAD
jgi:protein-tyrosine phosphatase